MIMELENEQVVVGCELILFTHVMPDTIKWFITSHVWAVPPAPTYTNAHSSPCV